MQRKIEIKLPSGFTFELLLVEGGAFDMGGSDPEARNSEKPVHRVDVPSFYLGKYPVTQALWKAVRILSSSLLYSSQVFHYLYTSR